MVAHVGGSQSLLVNQLARSAVVWPPDKHCRSKEGSLSNYDITCCDGVVAIA
jgi:hypothetical protein